MLAFTAGAVAAVPAFADGKPWAFISSGTWSLVGTEVSRPYLTKEARKANLTNEGGVCGTIRLLKNVSGLWLIQRLKKDLTLRGIRMEYPEIVSSAESAKPFRRFIDTEDASFHNPTDMVEAIDRYLANSKQPPAENPGDYARCIFESLAFRYTEVLNLLEKVTGRTFSRVHIVGGGAKNDLLNSFTANASGKEVFAGPFEATALGNGLVQALADHVFSSLTGLRTVVAESFPAKRFKPVHTDLWRKNFNRYFQVTHY